MHLAAGETAQVGIEAGEQGVADPPLERPECFLAGLALQITKDDDRSILVRQPAQLLVQQGQQVVPEFFLLLSWFRHDRHLLLPPPAPGGYRSGL